MKKKKLEHNPEIQKRLADNETTDKKKFMQTLRKAVKPSSQKPA